MMLQQLEYPFRYRWTVLGNVAVIGWGRQRGSDLLEGRALADLFSGIAREKEFSDLICGLNGCFAVVISGDGIVAAAVDRARSFPLLFKHQQDRTEISTDPGPGTALSSDPGVKEAFRRSWCVPGNHTLLKDWEQLQAGQYLWSARGHCRPRFYFRHNHQEKFREPEAELFNTGRDVLCGVFETSCRDLSGRTALVPLSGGYDSRLVLTMLKRYGHQRIMAYTYGHVRSHECRTAAKVAASFGIDWHFIPYDRELFSAFFSGSWSSYSRKNHFYTSLPHEQDFFALHALRLQGVLPEDFVALPGFCGDLLGGSASSCIPRSYDDRGFMEVIGRLQGSSWPVSDELHRIADADTFYDAFQHYFVINKVSKFIINSVRVYEHFGGSWMLPLWDTQLLKFWYRVPWSARRRQRLYNQILETEFFRPAGVDHPKPDLDSNYPDAGRAWLRKVAPVWLKAAARRLRHGYDPADPNDLRSLRDLILRSRGSTFSGSSMDINTAHAIYFLENLNK